MDYLPVAQADLKKRGWDQLDIILVSGDAYVDHPAWAAAILGRFLEHHGYKVGIIAQPNWQQLNDFQRLGPPRLFFGVTAGNLDSMVNHYTADKKKRHTDAYSPGGQIGLRPDRATIVYTNRLREAYPGIPVVIGGVESSLRRFAHYDYWSDRVRRSILLDSKADLLVFGMGEYTLLEIAKWLDSGKDIKDLTFLSGTGYAAAEKPDQALEIPAYDIIIDNDEEFSRATRSIFTNTNPYSSPPLAQRHSDRWVIMNPAPRPLTTRQMDSIYAIPFLRKYHPMYQPSGGIPALEPVQFSLLTHRGCMGGCYFCSIGLHQGKFIQSRSIDSLVKESRTFLDHPDFKGSIPDLGAASANMYQMQGRQLDKCQQCQRISCLHPGVCSNLDSDHSPSLRLWEKIRSLPGIDHIRVASGVRYDLILQEKSGRYLKELCRHHVGGQLKIAPEHISASVTKLMGKPGRGDYEKFVHAFNKVNKELGKKQFLVPYFISAHPGSSLEDSVELAEFLRDQMQYYPEQVQNFTPTPMTISTSMYYTGLNPLNGHKVVVAKSSWDRKAQRALLQFRKTENRKLVREALVKCGREDLIGSTPHALVRANSPSYNHSAKGFGNKTPGQKSSGKPHKNHKKR